SKDFLLRAAFIAKSSTCPLPIIERPQRNEEKEPVFNDIWVRPLQDTRLLGYLEERGINAHVAIPNCEEVRYRVRGKRYYAIGFRNNGGGLELRNRFFKGCIPPKDISLKRNGSDVCAVFEGFMDYLSAMQMGIIASDWLVLNSVSNVEKAVKALQGYERIECFLDNDDAGRRTFQRLHDCFGEKVIDRSALYADYKDLNEFLLSENAENNV
ncbi:toprim domain-containing protein, partial [Prevotella intermedia]